jgi:DoxX
MNFLDEQYSTWKYFTSKKNWRLTRFSMAEPFLAFVPYLALVARVWVGANMMIHGYSKLRNLKHAAEEAKKTLGVPIGATYTATILEVFGGLFLIIGLIVPLVALFFAIFMIANVIMKEKISQTVQPRLFSKRCLASYQIYVE